MKLVFISDHMNFSGGRKLHFLYAEHLQKKGHDVKIIVEKETGGLAGKFKVETVPALSREHLPDCDIIVATSPKEVVQAYESKRGKVVHFCQGFELTDLEQRINGTVIPPRYQGGGLLRKFELFRKKFAWKRKLKRFDDCYKLPTHLITVSSHLKKELEERYQRPVDLCRNGVHLDQFYPVSNWTYKKFTPENPMRIINIGPYDVTYKGIPTTLKAIEIAKSRGIPVEFMRITPVPSEAEKGATYKINEKMPQEAMCALVRSCDVYVSNSTEREGFGLPAIECMASGCACILSDILCYRSFSDRKDHCVFVKEGDSEATADAIEKLYKMSEAEFTAMRKNGLEVASDFSHDKAADLFGEILERIVKTGK